MRHSSASSRVDRRRGRRRSCWRRIRDSRRDGAGRSQTRSAPLVCVAIGLCFTSPSGARPRSGGAPVTSRNILLKGVNGAGAATRPRRSRSRGCRASGTSCSCSSWTCSCGTCCRRSRGCRCSRSRPALEALAALRFEITHRRYSPLICGEKRRRSKYHRRVTAARSIFAAAFQIGNSGIHRNFTPIC